MIELEHIPLRAHHVRQRLEAQRILCEHHGALAALRHVVLIDSRSGIR